MSFSLSKLLRYLYACERLGLADPASGGQINWLTIDNINVPVQHMQGIYEQTEAI